MYGTSAKSFIRMEEIIQDKFNQYKEMKNRLIENNKARLNLNLQSIYEEYLEEKESLIEMGKGKNWR